MKKFSLVMILLLLMGCGSTPYRDDYAKHVNLISNNYYNDESFQFAFSQTSNIDLRGLYQQDNTLGSSNMVYQGGAGIAGMLVQIGTHSAIVNSQRNSRLAQQQQAANLPISPLIELTKNLNLNDLIGPYDSKQREIGELDTDTLQIKPIFFSNSHMSRLSLKSVIWLPKKGKKKQSKKKRKKHKYQNMIQVYGNKLNMADRKKLTNNDTTFLSKQLSVLLQTTLYIAQNELTGKYSEKPLKAQTFIIEDGTAKKVIRGSLVAEKCGYQIIKDIRSWYIATPKPLESENNTNVQAESCNYI